GVMTALAVALFIAFFAMLGSINAPSPGEQVPLGQVLQAAKQRAVSTATIYDEDARIGVTTRSGQTAWAAYPKGEGQTSRLIDALTKSGAQFTVDQQSGKAAKRIVVQFL